MLLSTTKRKCACGQISHSLLKKDNVKENYIMALTRSSANMLHDYTLKSQFDSSK